MSLATSIRSLLRNFFKKTEGGKGNCNTCNKELASSGGNTTGLARHLPLHYWIIKYQQEGYFRSNIGRRRLFKLPYFCFEFVVLPKLSFNIGRGINQTSVAGAMARSGKLLLKVWKKSRRQETLNLSMCADTSSNTRKNKGPVAENYAPKILWINLDF